MTKMARRLVEDYVLTLQPGAEFTARDVCRGVDYHQGLNPMEVSNYLRDNPDVRKEGRIGPYTRYVKRRAGE